jgi:hypothetical protein
MPYCGRCLNVGRAGKRGAPPEYAVQPHQQCATSSDSTDSEQGQHAIGAAIVYEDLPGRAPANSAVVTTTACFAMTMSSSIACTSVSGSAQQSRTTTNP